MRVTCTALQPVTFGNAWTMLTSTIALYLSRYAQEWQR